MELGAGECGGGAQDAAGGNAMDFLIASGKAIALRELVTAACRAAGLKGEERIEASSNLLCPTELTCPEMIQG
jgi:hypothetical protein